MAAGITLAGAALLKWFAAHQAVAIGAGSIGMFTIPQILRQGGERKLQEKALGQQIKMFLAEQTASAKALKTSEVRSQEHMDLLMKLREQDRFEAREARSADMLSQTQMQQTALVMQAVQALGNEGVRPRDYNIAGSGMVGAMRGAY